MVDYASEREKMIERYRRAGYIKTRRVMDAINAVPREQFMEPRYREQAYLDQPFPIPGDGRQTISAPYMYPVTYEPLKLEKGQRFLEVGTGSGYGAAIARELVGPEGHVVTVEINPATYRFASENLRAAGYGDVKVVLGDGSLGYPDDAPYDAICITASAPDIPPPLFNQLTSVGRIIAPVGDPGHYGQDLLLVEVVEGAVSKRKLMSVVYVPLLGEHGFPG